MVGVHFEPIQFLMDENPNVVVQFQPFLLRISLSKPFEEDPDSSNEGCFGLHLNGKRSKGVITAHLSILIIMTKPSVGPTRSLFSAMFDLAARPRPTRLLYD